MSFETVNFEIKENVAVITLNRPDSLNSLSQQLTRDLTAAIEKVSEVEARAVVLTGAGRAFCAGGDLKEMNQVAQKEGRIEAFFEAPLSALHGAIRLIRNTPVPFVAAVNGVCAGAGTNFALACDMVIAADNAVFNEAFTKIGLTPDCGGTFFLPRVIGEKRAAELFMTASSVTAEKALEMGMINRVVPLADLESEAIALAAQLSKMPTGGIGRIKRMMNASFSNGLDAQLELEAQCQIESGRSEDFKEGVTAFFEKRHPQFKGK